MAGNTTVVYDLLVKTSGTNELQRLEAEVTKFSRATVDAQKAASTMRAPVAQLGNTFASFKGQLGNASYQIQDIAVQLAAGTSPARALAQQLPQLLSGFGTLGIVAGTAAAVIIPLAAALFDTGEKVKSLSQVSGEIKDSFGNWKAATTELQAELEKLRTKSVDTGAAIRQSLVGDVRLAKDQLLGSFKELTSSVGNEFKQFQGVFQNTESVLKRLSPTIMSSLSGFTKLGREMRATTPEAKALVNTLAGFENLGASRSELEGIATATEKVNRAAKSKDPLAYAQALTELKNQTQALLEKLGVAPGIIESIVGPLNDAAAAARNLAGGVDVARVAMNNFLVTFAKYQSAGKEMSSSYGFNFTPTIQGIETTTAKMERYGAVHKQMQADVSSFWTQANAGAQANARQLIQQNLPAADRLKSKIAELEQVRRTLGLNATAAETKALDTAIADLNRQLGELASEGGGGGGGKGGGGGGTMGRAAKAAKALGDNAKGAVAGIKDATDATKEWAQGLQSIAQNALSGITDALFAVAEGSKSMKEAMSDMLKSILKQVMDLIVQMLILKPLMTLLGGPAGGLLSGGGGLVSKSAFNVAPLSLPSPSSLVPKAPTLGNYSGFSMSPAALTSVRSSAISVGSGAPVMVQQPITINNNSDAVVRTRQDQTGTIIDIAIDAVADQITRGGGKIDHAMQRAFGARRVGY